MTFKVYPSHLKLCPVKTIEDYLALRKNILAVHKSPTPVTAMFITTTTGTKAAGDTLCS